MDFYELLEVSRSASEETIRAAFRSLSKTAHPDNQVTGDAQRFRQLKEAHETLTNPAKRKQYDEALRFVPQGEPVDNSVASAVDGLIAIGELFLMSKGSPAIQGMYKMVKPQVKGVIVGAIGKLA